MANDPLQPFWDHKEITEKVGEWCRIVDARALDRMSEVFALDVEWDFGKGTVDHGLDKVVERINAHFAGLTHCGLTQHHVSNFRVTLDGDRAESDAYIFAVHAGVGEFEGRNLLMWGNYNDHWRRTPQGWRVVKRNYRIDINDGPMEIVYGHAPKGMWQDDDERALRG